MLNLGRQQGYKKTSDSMSKTKKVQKDMVRSENAQYRNREKELT